VVIPTYCSRYTTPPLCHDHSFHLDFLFLDFWARFLVNSVRLRVSLVLCWLKSWSKSRGKGNPNGNTKGHVYNNRLYDPIETTLQLFSCGSQSGRIYHDFSRLFFHHAHREVSPLVHELPEESDQFRFLRDASLGNLKGSVGLILVKASVMRISIRFDLSSRTFLGYHYQGSLSSFFWVLIDLIVELLCLIIKPFDNQTERWNPVSNDLIIKSFDTIIW